MVILLYTLMLTEILTSVSNPQANSSWEWGNLLDLSFKEGKLLFSFGPVLIIILVVIAVLIAIIYGCRFFKYRHHWST